MTRLILTRVLQAFLITVCALFMTAFSAYAAEPVSGALGMQLPASTSAEHINDFHNLLLIIIITIALFVLALLLYVIVRYNRHVNPVPKQFTHNVMVEIIWTVIPVVILIIIAIPSFKLLYYTDRVQEPEMTLKVAGYQWFWGYEYPDRNEISFMSYMIPTAEIDESKGQKRLLSVDNPVYLPINTNIQILMTGGDVIHSWAVPALGIKLDAIPGRLNETWVNITRPGTYYGQCSEICGKDHAYMPIEIRAVPRDEFEAWAASGGNAALLIEGESE